MPRDGNKSDLGVHLVTPGQLQKYLGITRQTRYNWEQSGKLPPRDRVGGWNRRTIDSWEEQSVLARAERTEELRKRNNREEPT